MDYQKLIVAGNTTAAAEERTSKSGDVDYTTFNVAVSTGKDRTIYFPVTVFGERGKKLAPHITKGRQVLVEGRIEVGDQGRFNVIGDEVRLGVQAQKGKAEAPKADSAE